MTVDIKKYVLIVAVGALLFAAGRYSVQSPKIEQIVHTVQDTTKQVDKDQNVKKTTVVVKEVDGKTTTTTTEERNTKTLIQSDTKLKADVETTITSSKQTLSVSALAGVNVIEPRGVLYGVAVAKEAIGPITLGVWGLSNGTVGGTIGLNF